MASITELGNIPAQTVTAYTDSFKTIAFIVGGAVTTIAAAVNTFFSHRNTQVTKENTLKATTAIESNSLNIAVAQALAPLLAEQKTQIEKMMADALETAKKDAESLKVIQSDFQNIKIAIAKVSDKNAQGLSLIPKVQDAVEKLTYKVSIHDANFRLIKKHTDEINKKKGAT